MRSREAGSVVKRSTRPSQAPLASSIIADSLSEGSSPAAISRWRPSPVGLPPSWSMPSASRSRRAGSTVITAVLRPVRAAASARAAAIVVLPTPPVPSTIRVEPFLNNSFKLADAAFRLKE
ncbi:MAG TPA: hypothetical protein VFE56_12040 [Candidatus Binataceae bacterium]|nr:hypothetical protein [Candidatus Binataceae bacterium]